ncbi:unnamed protein product [Bursaphelenchus xylophilus]|uniref:(pine wood nematode) hypothetical protein n=1 Tax=Bursaphelenchus xylophilus TaxID=6326 RepID=A0A1I7S1Z7_BURXY|nr:unnamed protein product [Bursaphelenchus xylophilus]CAG9090172.1 unnamed protein product [Bursaphelenchus xylophilus]
MKALTLGNGVEMPVLGLGTLQSSSEECMKAIHAALDADHRLIDTASISKNEEDVGKALEAYFETGKLSRKDVFITTRVWSEFKPPEDVEKTLREKLKALRTDYVDLYLIHQPPELLQEYKDTTRLDNTWKAMEEVYKKGLARSIGGSNFCEYLVESILSICEVPMHILQVEQDFFYNDEIYTAIELCQDQKIPLTMFARHRTSGMMRVFYHGERG